MKTNEIYGDIKGRQGKGSGSGIGDEVRKKGLFLLLRGLFLISLFFSIEVFEIEGTQMYVSIMRVILIIGITIIEKDIKK